ncbi:MAG: aminopeptidase [Gemmatimonadota bacterium]
MRIRLRGRWREGPGEERHLLAGIRGPLVTALALLFPLLAGACSPIYVVKAGIAEARILAGRRPIPEVLLDTATQEDVQGKLAYVWEARRFAADSLGLRVGDQYTSYTRLSRDTLALVLSAAPVDALEPVTWWFPIVGRLPYRAYFDDQEAHEEQRSLEEEGYDTYLRPTAAFSTLGWFSDPLLSTVLRAETVSVVETVYHELAHTHLFVPGHVRFNESFATFVGSVGSIAFFCGREGGGPRSVKCLRAKSSWSDLQRFSRFLDEVVAELEALYAEPEVHREELVTRKTRIMEDARERFREVVLPELEIHRFSIFTDLPLNNATVLARMRYYHRLPDFQAFLDAHGGRLADALSAIEDGLPEVDDPWDLLPGNSLAEFRCTRPVAPVG